MWIQFLAIVGLRSVREILNSLPQEGPLWHVGLFAFFLFIYLFFFLS